MSESSSATGVPVRGRSSEDETRTWIRWSGVAFALTFVVGWILATMTWDDPDQDQKIIDWYASEGNRIRQVVGAYLVSLAGFAFVGFSIGLGRLVPRASVAQLLRALSQLFTALLLAGAVAISTVSASVIFPSYPEVEDAALLRIIESLGFGMVLLPGLMAAGLAVVAASVGLRGTQVLPSWLVVAGYVVGGILVVGGTLYIPVVLLIAWVLAVAFTARPESAAVATSESVGAVGPSEPERIG